MALTPPRSLMVQVLKFWPTWLLRLRIIGIALQIEADPMKPLGFPFSVSFSLGCYVPRDCVAPGE